MYENSFIYLFLFARILLDRRCGIPETMERVTRFPISPCIGLGLHCLPGYPDNGGLLPLHFTLTSWLERRYFFCCTCREASLTKPPLAFTRNPTLWCPDFPLLKNKFEQRTTTSRKFLFFMHAKKWSLNACLIHGEKLGIFMMQFIGRSPFDV